MSPLRRRPAVEAIACLLGIGYISTGVLKPAGSEVNRNDLPSGAVAKLGAPARFIKGQWQYHPTAHDRSLGRLAYIDLQGNVIIEEVANAQRRKVLDASIGSVYKLRMSRDEQTIYAQTEDAKEYQIAIKTGAMTSATPNQLAALPAPSVLGESPNGEYEARMGNDCVEVYRSGQSKPMTCLAVKFEPPPAPPGLIVDYGWAPFSCSFSRDNKRLAVWRTSSKLLIYDLRSGLELHLETLGDQIVTASFSPNGQEAYLVRRRDPKSLERWSVEDGRRLPSVELEDRGSKTTAAGSAWLSPGGRVLVARHYWGFTAWRPRSGRMLWNFETEARDVRQVDFSADCRRILILSESASSPGLLELLDAETGAPISDHPGHQERVMGLAFSPDGRHLVSTDAVRESIAWDVGNRRAAPRAPIPWNRQGSYSPVAGNSLWISATGIDDISIQRYAGGEPRVLPGAGKDLGAMALSGDEREVAVLNEQQNRLCLWSVEKVELRWCADLRPPSSQTINFSELQFSADDSFVVTRSETGELLRWRHTDGTTANPVELLADQEASRAAVPSELSISDQRLADDPCIAWLVKDTATKTVLFASSLRRDFLSSFVKIPSSTCLFTPDGRLAIFVVGEDRIIIRRTADGDALAELPGHVGKIFTYAISPDGSLLASAGTDHVIYLWELSRYR